MPSLVQGYLAHKKLICRSGLYGVLRPFDLIRPYRPEMNSLCLFRPTQLVNRAF